MSGMDSTLTWDGSRWHGHTETHCMFMSQETFQTYLTTYQEGLRGQALPTPQEALSRVTRLSYWAYARYDRTIHFVRLPGCIHREKDVKA